MSSETLKNSSNDETLIEIQCTASGEVSEDLLFEIVEELQEFEAIQGYSQKSATTFSIFVLGDPGLAEQIVATNLSSRDIKGEILSHSPKEQQAWVQKCEEVFEPLTIGRITITPIVSPEHLPADRNPDPFNLYLVPGMGFGTGHHETTSGVMELLQDPQIIPEGFSPNAALDIGSGSGILSNVAYRLFGCPVKGWEIDGPAVENSKENAALNNIPEDQVQFINAPFENDGKKYDLVIANIYAEVLNQLSQPIVNSLSEKGILFLSGIMNEKAEDVKVWFEAAGLITKKKLVKGNWTSFVFGRN